MGIRKSLQEPEVYIYEAKRAIPDDEALYLEIFSKDDQWIDQLQRRLTYMN